MEKLVAAFTDHLKTAIEIGSKQDKKASENTIQNVVITGLGGSGIGGKIAAQLVQDEINVPVVTNNDYGIPSFVSENTLLIASSYSGNTEETLEAVEKGKEKGAEIFCITSGGKLADFATNNGYGLIQIPGGLPPRAAFGYSFPQLFVVLASYGLIENNKFAEIESAVSTMNNGLQGIKTEAQNIAKKLFGKTTAIYAEAKFEGMATRFRQQLNENSKVLCWHHVLPEMNHNELVGWAGGSKDIAVVLIKNESDYYRTKERFIFSEKVFSQYTDTLIEINSQGKTDLERTLYLIHLTDWVSVYLAELRGVDPVEVDIITSLKAKLADL